MNEKPVVLRDPSDVFSIMVVSSVFEPRSASIEEKRRIFEKFWANYVSGLQSNFDSAGKRPETDDFGFGFLVEGFALYSERLPKRNTEKGEEVAKAILSALHSGRSSNLVRLDHSLSNSDFLWVKQTGRLTTITGIGEIKSSYQAALQKVGGQLKRQETALGFLVERLKEAKTNKTINGFFQRRKVVVSESLERVLIVPFGEGEKARQDDKFSDWLVIELEFSYSELIFIAQQIWPNFRPDIQIGPGKLANLDQMALKLGEWVKPRLDDIFSDSEEFGTHNPLPYFEIGLFVLATGKTPLLEDEVKWSVELVRNSFWPAVQRCLNLFPNSTSCSQIDFSEKEKGLFSKFWYVLTSNREDLGYFLCFIRSLNTQIKDLAREQGQLKQLAGMSEVWKI